MSTHQSKEKTAVKQGFLEAFSKKIDKRLVVNKEHTQRTLTAITLLSEYVRRYYGMKSSKQSLKKIRKYVSSLMALEDCERQEISQAVKQSEMRLCEECSKHMTGLGGLEVSFVLKHSCFPEVRAHAEDLSDICTSRQVIAE